METKTNETLEKKFYIEQLNDSDRVASFDCGDADLNDFILNEAAPYRKAMLAVTYVFEDKVTKQAASTTISPKRNPCTRRCSKSASRLFLTSMFL